MQKKRQHINLLRNQDKHLLDKLLDWAFTVGRAIVIITESVALSAFAYRFVLDRQIIDLRDKIKQEQAIVTLSKANEIKFRNLQDRLAVVKELDAKSTEKTTFLADLLAKANGKMSFRTIQLSGDSVALDGIVSSAQSLSSFIADLRSHPLIKSVTISKLQNSTTTGTITAALTVEFKKPAQ